MAYVGKRWLDYDAREKYLAEIRGEQSLLLRIIQEDIGTDADIDRFEVLRKEYDRVARVHRGERDVLYFGFEYFSEEGNPNNPDNLIPLGTTVANAAEFHQTLSDLFNNIASGMQKDHVAWACPRRHGKTAWISNIFLTHQIVYRHRKYIVLFSETTDVAGDFITWARYQLKLNDKLREDFGVLLEVRPSMNILDNKLEFITSSNTKVEAKGLGTQSRGLRHGASRPDLFILDDLESKDSTNTPDLIDKSKRWFNEEMLPALAKDGLCVYLGTILCYGSLLHYVIEERKDFRSRLFGAVKEYAEDETLWTTWRDIYREDDEDAPQRAYEFYLDNEEAMLEGAQVLWPDQFPYYDLMKIKEDGGAKAFSQEYQNTPTDEERQIFKPDEFYYYNDEDLKGKNIKYYSAIDIGMGKQKGDYTVIATIAKNEDTGICYLHDLYMARVHPDVLIKEAVHYALMYQYEAMGIEAQFAQEFIADKIGDALQEHGYPRTRIKQIKQRTRKQLRIEALLPDLQNGRLRIHNKLRNQLEQFEMYPMHPHDDVPDAVAMAFQTAKEGYGFIGTVRSMDRWSRGEKGFGLDNRKRSGNRGKRRR